MLFCVFESNTQTFGVMCELHPVMPSEVPHFLFFSCVSTLLLPVLSFSHFLLPVLHFLFLLISLQSDCLPGPDWFHLALSTCTSLCIKVPPLSLSVWCVTHCALAQPSHYFSLCFLDLSQLDCGFCLCPFGFVCLPGLITWFWSSPVSTFCKLLYVCVCVSLLPSLLCI